MLYSLDVIPIINKNKKVRKKQTQQKGKSLDNELGFNKEDKESKVKH